MKCKVFSLEEVLEHIHDGQTISFSDVHGGHAPDQIIEGMLAKGVKDITAIAIAAGNPGEGVGKLIVEHRVKKLHTTHTAMNPESVKQMLSGELEIEYNPMGTWIERQHAAAAGLGGVLTPTGVGTEVEEGKQKLTLNGREYLVELPLGADVSIMTAWRADKAGNVQFRGNFVGHDTMALASKFCIFEVEEIVEVGVLGPKDIDIPAPVTDMVYCRTGVAHYPPLMWRKAIAKAEGGKK